MGEEGIVSSGEMRGIPIPAPWLWEEGESRSTWSPNPWREGDSAQAAADCPAFTLKVDEVAGADAGEGADDKVFSPTREDGGEAFSDGGEAEDAMAGEDSFLSGNV